MAGILSDVRLNAPPQQFTMDDINSLAAASHVPQVRMNLGDRIGAFMANPENRAALLRAGAAMMSTGDVGQGILAGANFVDSRRLERENNRRRASDEAFRDRGQGETERSNRVREGQADRGLDNQRYGIDTTRRGQDIGFQADVMRDGTTRRGQDIGFQSDVMRDRTARRGQDVSLQSSREGNATQERVANIYGSARVDAATARGQSPASYGTSRNAMKAVMPGILSDQRFGGVSEEDFRAALAASPDLEASLYDATGAGWQQGGAEGARAAALGILGQYDFQAPSSGFFGIGARPGAFNMRSGATPPTAPASQPQGPTATDPRTGRKVMWDGQSWVPVR